MLGNLGFFTFSSPSFSALMLFCNVSTIKWECQICDKREERRSKGNGTYLDLGKEVDPDTLGLQTPRLLDPHPEVLHVRVDDVLHRSAEFNHKRKSDDSLVPLLRLNSNRQKQRDAETRGVSIVTRAICHASPPNSLPPNHLWCAASIWHSKQDCFQISHTVELFNINTLH